MKTSTPRQLTSFARTIGDCVLRFRAEVDQHDGEARENEPFAEVLAEQGLEAFEKIYGPEVTRWFTHWLAQDFLLRRRMAEMQRAIDGS